MTKQFLPGDWDPADIEHCRKLVRAAEKKRDEAVDRPELESYGDLESEDLRDIRVRAALACADVDPAADQATRDREDLLRILDELADCWRERSKSHKGQVEELEQDLERVRERVDEVEEELHKSDSALRAERDAACAELVEARALLAEQTAEVVKLRDWWRDALLAVEEAERREAGALRGERVAREELEAGIRSALHELELRAEAREAGLATTIAAQRAPSRTKLDAARTAPCATCHASPGQPCRATGRVGSPGSEMKGSVHAARKRAAKGGV